MTQACVTGSALAPEGCVAIPLLLVHVQYGLRAGSVNIVEGYSALDKGAALQPVSTAKGACSVKPCRSRRLPRLLRNTSRPIVHVAVLPDRRQTVGPGCHAVLHLSSASAPSPTASDQDARVSS
jgi:hypothetical protein